MHPVFFPFAVCPQKCRQNSPQIVFFELVKVFTQSHVLIAKCMLHYRSIVTALKIIIYNNVLPFCLETQEMYQKLNIVYF